MAKQDKIQMPSSGAGITQYFQEFHTKLQLKPEHVIILAALIIVIEIILFVFGNELLGITP